MLRRVLTILAVPATGGGRAWPTTAFYNAQGNLVYTHQGAYASEKQLAEDIQRYAIDG